MIKELEMTDENRDAVNEAHEAENVAYKEYTTQKSTVAEAQHEVRSHFNTHGDKNNTYVALTSKFNEEVAKLNDKKQLFEMAAGDLRDVKSRFGGKVTF